MRKVLVTGSRSWGSVEGDTRMMSKAMRTHRIGPGDVVVHGDATGADRMAGRMATTKGAAVVAVAADWARYGKGAGPVRNQAMLDLYGPFDLVLVFHHDLENSRGTKDMVKRVSASHHDKIVYYR